MKRLFRGGIVVSGEGCKKADVLIEDEKIVKVEENIEDPADEVLDVTGKYLFPGCIGIASPPIEAFAYAFLTAPPAIPATSVCTKIAVQQICLPAAQLLIFPFSLLLFCRHKINCIPRRGICR